MVIYLITGIVFSKIGRGHSKVQKGVTSLTALSFAGWVAYWLVQSGLPRLFDIYKQQPGMPTIFKSAERFVVGVKNMDVRQLYRFPLQLYFAIRLPAVTSINVLGLLSFL